MEMERISKFLSLVLRHQPEKIGLQLNENGWAEIEVLVANAGQHGILLTQGMIESVVSLSDKKRFALSEDGKRIRANQGHSVQIDLGLSAQAPPKTLFHGTATRFLKSIQAVGLLPGSRQHVHLSSDEATAVKVGSRHGKSVVLLVDAGAMHRAGIEFYQSANGVWLTASVAPQYLTFPI